MADDLVQKLRTWKGKALTHVVLKEAADEIERLRSHIERLTATHPLAADYKVVPQKPADWIAE